MHRELVSENGHRSRLADGGRRWPWETGMLEIVEYVEKISTNLLENNKNYCVHDVENVAQMKTYPLEKCLRVCDENYLSCASDQLN